MCRHKRQVVAAILSLDSERGLSLRVLSPAGGWVLGSWPSTPRPLSRADANLRTPPAALLPAMLPALLPAPPAPPALPPVLAPLAQLALPTLLTPTLLNVPRRRAYVRPMRRRASSHRHSTHRWTRERRFLLFGRGCGRCLGSAGSTEGSGGDRGRASTSRSSSGPCCIGTPRSRSCIRRTSTPPSAEASSTNSHFSSTTAVKNTKRKPATCNTLSRGGG